MSLSIEIGLVSLLKILINVALLAMFLIPKISRSIKSSDSDDEIDDIHVATIPAEKIAVSHDQQEQQQQQPNTLRRSSRPLRPSVRFENRSDTVRKDQPNGK